MLTDGTRTDDAGNQLQRACAELRRRLHAGECCRTEDLLAKFTAVASHEDMALRLALTELHLRQTLGEVLSPREWYERFPRWRERLQEQFATASAYSPADSG